jgi:hypothetical protein
MQRFPLHFVCVILLLLSSKVQADGTYYVKYHPELKHIYIKILESKFEESRMSLERLRTREPNNLAIDHLENYADCFQIFVTEDNTLFKKYKVNKSLRINKFAKLPLSDPYNAYLQADVLMQWSAARLKFEEYIIAFRDISRAYKLLDEILDEDPDFAPALKNKGILSAIIGTVPDKYKWGIKLIGLDGSIPEGLKMMERILTLKKHQPFFFEEEVHAAIGLTHFYFNNQPEKAIQTFQHSKLKAINSPLLVFLVANMYRRSGQNDKALGILQNAKFPSGTPAFPFLDFIEGDCRLRKLDKNADIYLKRFLKHYNGRNYIKESYQKLAWHGLIFKNEVSYKNYMDLVLEEGYQMIDEDKSALKEAESGIAPHPILLKARLSFDGGYYSACRKVLSDLSESKLSPTQKLEIQYRQARVTEKLDGPDAGIQSFLTLIKQNPGSTSYFVCNAALLCAQLYEEEGQKVKAAEYYRICLRLKSDDYRMGIHQKAKAGLQRVKRK